MTAAQGAPPEVVQAGERRSARVESLRAVAALGVLGAHVFAFAHGWRPVIFDGFLHRVIMGGGFGVQLFFALSGFLLYRAFAQRDFGDGRQVGIASYATNRALRILPLYLVSVAVLLIATQHGGTGRQWLRFLTLSQEFSKSTAQTVDGPMWSLVVEVHFYIALPILAWVIARIARGSAVVAAATILALGVASAALRQATLTPVVVWAYSFPVTFYGFVPGMLLALMLATWVEGQTVWLRGAIASADAWILGGIGLFTLVFWHYGWDLLTAPACFLVVGACVLPLAGGPLVRLLDWRPLALVGVASYSLYLWHVPIIEQVVRRTNPGSLGLLAVCLPIALAVSLVSYRLVERPALRYRRPWQARSADTVRAGGDGRPADHRTA